MITDKEPSDWTRYDIVTIANRCGITLSWREITPAPDGWCIEGLPADEWLDNHTGGESRAYHA
jgi:hypothetical protein